MKALRGGSYDSRFEFFISACKVHDLGLLLRPGGELRVAVVLGLLQACQAFLLLLAHFENVFFFPPEYVVRKEH